MDTALSLVIVLIAIIGCYLLTLIELERGEKKIMKELDDLTNAVNALKAAVSSAVSDIANLSQQIKSASADPVAIEALATQVNDAAVALNSAVNPIPPVTP